MLFEFWSSLHRACWKTVSYWRVSSSFGYGCVNAIFIMVRKACWMRAGASANASEKFFALIDSKMVGKRVVFSLQMCEIETAADVLNTSFVCVW